MFVTKADVWYTNFAKNAVYEGCKRRDGFLSGLETWAILLCNEGKVSGAVGLKIGRNIGWTYLESWDVFFLYKSSYYIFWSIES